MKIQIITAYVRIGKGKELINYIFHVRDFIRIEDNMLILRDEERRLTIDEETKRQIIYQMNQE